MPVLRKRHSQTNAVSHRGVSLVELVVAMAILTIIIGMGISMIFETNRFVQVQEKKYNSIIEGEHIMRSMTELFSSCQVPVDGRNDYSAAIQPEFFTFRIPIDVDRKNDYFNPDGTYIHWGAPENVMKLDGAGGIPGGSLRMRFVPSGEFIDENHPTQLEADTANNMTIGASSYIQSILQKKSIARLPGIDSNLDPFTSVSCASVVKGKVKLNNINQRYENSTTESSSNRYFLGCLLIQMVDAEQNLYVDPAGRVTHRTIGGHIQDEIYNKYKGGDNLHHMRAMPKTCIIAVPEKMIYYIYDAEDTPAGLASQYSIDGNGDDDPFFEVSAINKLRNLPMQIRIKFSILKYDKITKGWFFQPMKRTVQLRNPQKYGE